MTMLPAPLPGRPAVGGAMGGSRLGWFVTDPQGTALGSYAGRAMDSQSPFHPHRHGREHEEGCVRLEP